MALTDVNAFVYMTAIAEESSIDHSVHRRTARYSIGSRLLEHTPRPMRWHGDNLSDRTFYSAYRRLVGCRRRVHFAYTFALCTAEVVQVQILRQLGIELRSSIS